jgi:cysteine desulfurase / selenocysteine lyase
MDDLNLYVGNAERFPILTSWDFYNHAGVSPLPHESAQAVIAYALHAESQSYLNAHWRPAVEETRAAAASLLNADKSEIAFVRSTAEGLGIVAGALDWKAGDVIVTTGVEYPTNIYPWMDAANRHGVKLVMVPEQTDADGRQATPLEEILKAASQPHVKMLAISHVEFGSGQRHDMETLGRFCRERGILFTVDAIQSFGAVPIDVGRMQIDYLSAGGQKWLLSPEGTGIFFCRRELLPTTRPLMVGALSVVNAMDFDHYDFTLRPDARRFESGGFNIGGLMGMKASLDLFNSLGIDAISQRIKTIGDRLIAGMTAKGYPIASPRTGTQWSGILSFASPNHVPDTIAANLRTEHHIEIAVRQGRLRISPHFYNTEAQIDRLVSLLP